MTDLQIVAEKGFGAESGHRKKVDGWGGVGGSCAVNLEPKTRGVRKRKLIVRARTNICDIIRVH